MNSAQLRQSPFPRHDHTTTARNRRAFILSIAAHMCLIALLTVGIRWHSSTPSGVEVELWDATPQIVQPEAPVKEEPLKVEAADIAVKKTVVEKIPPKLEVKEPPKPVKVVPPPPPPPPKEPPKNVPPKPVTPPPLTPAQMKANAAAEKVRADQLARINAAANAEGGRGGTVGNGVGTGGNAPPGWTDKVIRKVKPLIVFNPESVSGNPAAVVSVDLAPDGTILSRNILTSSGNAGWDRAVLLALERAESLPKDDNGLIPQRQVKLTFKPRD